MRSTPTATRLFTYGLFFVTAASCADKKLDSRQQDRRNASDASPEILEAPIEALPAATTPTSPAEAMPEPPLEAPSVDLGEAEPLPNALTQSDWFRFVYDPDSLRGIRDNRGFRNLGANLENRIIQRLVTTSEDGMLFTQTYGDGQTQNVGTRELINSAMDLGRNTNTRSISGVHMLRQERSESCPAPFACASQLIVAPFTGEPRTLCFNDAQTAEPALYPYGALPGFQAADFETAFGEYGPFRVKAYTGKDIDCTAPGTEPVADEEIMVAVTPSNTASLSYSLHTVEPIPADYAVVFEHRRSRGDMRSPFTDETLGLDFRSQYYFSSDAQKLVKLVVTSRQSINVAAEAGGGLIGGIIGLFNNIDGIAVDLHFEFCEDLLDEQAPLHCVDQE